MNLTRISILTGCIVVLCAGCASQKGDRERGWIGGEYALARPFKIFWHMEGSDLGLPKDLPPEYHAGALITELSTNTPAARAGIVPGDLVIAAAGKPVHNLPDFRAEIDQTRPGSALSLGIYRDGKILEKSVIVGRERYKQESTFCMVVGASSHFEVDLIPDPNFSLIALGYNRDQSRVELDDVRMRYQRSTYGKAPDGAVESKEGWQAWVGPLSVAGHKRILSQQPVESEAAPPCAKMYCYPNREKEGSRCAKTSVTRPVFLPPGNSWFSLRPKRHSIRESGGAPSS